MEQSAGVGRDRFEVPPLGLGVERAEGEGRFAGTRYACENDEGIARNFEVDILEVVFACSANFDESGPRRGISEVTEPSI